MNPRCALLDRHPSPVPRRGRRRPRGAGLRIAFLSLLAGVFASNALVGEAGGAAGEGQVGGQKGDRAEAGEAPLQAGFGKAEITPKLGDTPVWIAGYGTGRQATGIHDPLWARAVVLRAGEQTLALVSVDLVGLQFREVTAARKAVPDVDYLMVSSTHNHEGPDVIGLWGKSHLQRGVDPRYLDQVVAGIVEAVRDAGRRMQPVTARFGTASDPTLVGDSRLPHVKDDVLRVLQFRTLAGDTREAQPPAGKVLGTLVQWSAHPEAMGPRNQQLTADFPAATISHLQRAGAGEVIYFAGAVGGLMAPPDDRVRSPQGALLKEGDFAFARQYGTEVGRLAEQAIQRSAPIRLTPLRMAAVAVQIPVHNPYYRTAWSSGVLQRTACVWSGDWKTPGEPLKIWNAAATMAITTEVACLQLGHLRVACLPGEIYPELVYGKVQTPPDPAADFPDAPVEPSVADVLDSPKWMLFGLANDEIGYIIPRRQWDRSPPFCYGRKKSQYGEVNSCGALVAPQIMDALKHVVGQLAPAAVARPQPPARRGSE